MQKKKRLLHLVGILFPQNNTYFTRCGGGGGCSLDSPERTSAKKKMLWK
jgi:hypothetical protein